MTVTMVRCPQPGTAPFAGALHFFDLFAEIGLNDFLTTLTRWSLRLLVLALGTLLFFGLLALAAALAVVWGLRALWARLTGQPMRPWSMRMDPRSGWSTVYRSTARWTAQATTAATTAASDGAHSRPLHRLRDITDVEPREVR